MCVPYFDNYCILFQTYRTGETLGMSYDRNQLCDLRH